VGLLCVFRLVLEEIGRVWHVIGAELRVDLFSDVGQGVVRQHDRVGAHVRDQALYVAVDLDAFVEGLGDTHGFLRRKLQFAGRVLLQGRGNEWGRGLALAFLAFDPVRFQAAAGRGDQLLLDRHGAFCVMDVELVILLAVQAHQVGGKRMT